MKCGVFSLILSNEDDVVNVRIESLKELHDVGKWDFIIIFLYYDLNFHYSIHVCINVYLSIQDYITCIVHDFGALGVILNIQVIGSLQVMSCLQSIHELRQLRL